MENYCLPNLDTWLAATSILSAELLNVHLKSTSGGFASTIHLIWAFSCFATPYTRGCPGAHVGASVDLPNTHIFLLLLLLLYIVYCCEYYCVMEYNKKKGLSDFF